MMRLSEILQDRERAIVEARGMLAKLFRIVLRDRNVTYFDYERLMQQWLDNPINNIPKFGKERSSERGNIIKELERGDMTWRGFHKHIRFLKIKRLHIRLTLTDHNEISTIHEYGATISSINEDIEALSEVHSPVIIINNTDIRNDISDALQRPLVSYPNIIMKNLSA